MRALVLLLVLAPLLAALAGAAGDEFDGGDVNADWQVVRESRQDWSLDGAYLRINPTPGDLVGPTNDARNVFLQPAPAGDFRVTTQLEFFATGDGQRAGLLLYAGDDDFFYLGAGRDGARVVEAVVETDGVPEVAAEATEWSPLFLRLERANGTLTSYASPDGILWRVVGRAPAPDPDGLRIGLFAAKGVRPDDGVLDAAFAHFRLESPPVGETRTEPPVFTLTATPSAGQAPLEVAFHGASSWDYPGLTWTLTFGDGTTPAAGEGLPFDVAHTYAEPAGYTARLTARNVVGVVGSVTAAVRATTEPVAPAPDDPPARGDDTDAPRSGADPVPGATVSAPEGAAIEMLDASGEPVERAQGVVRLRALGSAEAANATFAVVGEDGARTPLEGATWDTTRGGNGRYVVEARHAGVVLASREVVVENPRASAFQAAGAVGAGVATVGLLSLGASAFGSRLDLFGYVGDAAQDLGEDIARSKTAEIAALDRKRRLRSVLLAGAAMLLSAVLFAYAEVQPWDAAFFLAALPFFAGAAFLYAGTRFASEAEAARATGATVLFRIWVAGTLALLVSALVFRSPFGYPGFLRKNEPVVAEPRSRRRTAGLRALTSLGIYLAVMVPFAVLALWWRYDFGEIGLTMALSAFGTAVLPFQPLPGGNVWRWNRAVAVALAVAGIALYFLFQLALLPVDALLVVGLAGAASAVATVTLVRGATRTATEVEVNEDG